MKKLFYVLIALMVFVACSSEREAERRLPQYMKTEIADPEQSIENKSIVWEDDSLCIIEFTLRARNEFGGYELRECQYFLVQVDGKKYEGCCLRPQNSFFQDGVDRDKTQAEIEKLYHQLARNWLFSCREVH